MNIFDVFSPEELDELPDEPQAAFSAFVRKATAVLGQRVNDAISGDPSDGWRVANDERHGFMNMVIAAGKRYEIEPFANYAVPKTSEWGDTDFREFEAELDHYMTQLVLDNSIRTKREAVTLPPKSKERIRNHVNALRRCIEEANLTDAKKATLSAKLDAFEKALERQRLPILAVTLVTLEVLALPGGVWQSGEIVTKLVTNVLHEVGEAKAADDEARQLPPVVEPGLLSPPRPLETRGRMNPPAFEPGGMDDDIPF